MSGFYLTVKLCRTLNLEHLIQELGYWISNTSSSPFPENPTTHLDPPHNTSVVDMQGGTREYFHI